MVNDFNEIPWVKRAERMRKIRVFFLRLIGVLIVFGCIGGYSFLRYANPKTEIHTIKSIDKVENVHGTKNAFSTELYWVVVTDKGTYHIMTDGFNAAQNCANIEAGKTYKLTTRGYTLSFFGFYRCIVAKQEIQLDS